MAGMKLTMQLKLLPLPEQAAAADTTAARNIARRAERNAAERRAA
jgi:cob(I)alamin adenosyltransferase